MKFRIANALFAYAALALFLALAFTAQAKDGPLPEGRKLKILVAGGEAVVALFKTPLAEKFLCLLPLEVEFSDFAGAEKIFSLPDKLDLSGAVNADTQKGDFCYYAPWGNMAVFYKGYGRGKSLYVVGNIESGKEKLAAMKENFKARIEVVNERQGTE